MAYNKTNKWLQQVNKALQLMHIGENGNPEIQIQKQPFK